MERGRVIAMKVLGASLCGLAGFAAGFFGPIYFTPGANQGPLLGIIFTGPIGVAAGVPIGGWLAKHARVAVAATLVVLAATLYGMLVILLITYTNPV